MNHISFVFDSIIPVSSQSRRNSQLNSFPVESSEKGENNPLELKELDECIEQLQPSIKYSRIPDKIMFHSAKIYEEKCFNEMIKSVKLNAAQKNKLSFKRTRHPSLSLDTTDKYVQSESSLILRKMLKKKNNNEGNQNFLSKRQNKNEEDSEKEISTIDSNNEKENYFNFNNIHTIKNNKMSKFTQNGKNQKSILRGKKRINEFECEEEEGKYSSDEETLSFNERDQNYEEIEKRIYQFLDQMNITYYIVNKRDEYNEKMRNKIALDNKAYAPSPIILRRKAKGLTIPNLDGLRILSHCQSIDSGESKSLPKLKIPPEKAKRSSYHHNYNIFFDQNQGFNDSDKNSFYSRINAPYKHYDIHDYRQLKKLFDFRVGLGGGGLGYKRDDDYEKRMEMKRKQMLYAFNVKIKNSEKIIRQLERSILINDSRF